MMFLGKEVKNHSFNPYIVAEISGNHGGKIERAFQLIEAAKSAGADAVKIQCYDADALTLPIKYDIMSDSIWKGENIYELYMKGSTPYEWLGPLFDFAKNIEFTIFSSVYDDRGIEALEKVGCRAYKIASYEANDVEFIRKVVSLEKPVVLSTGSLNTEETLRAIDALSPTNSIVLHCVSNYPTKLEGLGLDTMRGLMYICNQPVGISYHSDEDLGALLAIQAGAAMIETHLTLYDEEAEREALDWTFSFTPQQLNQLIEKLKIVRKANTPKSANEEGIRYKRSLFATRFIRKGETFTQNNVGSYRPNLGCAPYLLSDIIGKKASQDIHQYAPMKMEYVNDI